MVKTVKNRYYLGSDGTLIESFDCLACGFTANKRQDLLDHMNLKHGDEYNMQCKLCNYSLSYITQYYDHLLKHSNAYAYKCKDCNELFRNTRDFCIHRRIKCTVTSINLTCDKCGFISADKRSLIAHKATHNTIKNYVCEFCDKRCKSKETYRYHKRKYHTPKGKIFKNKLIKTKKLIIEN